MGHFQNPSAVAAETIFTESEENLPLSARGEVLSLSSGNLERAIQGACQWSVSNQEEEGYWVGELLGDTTTESYAILLKHFMGLGQDPRIPKYARSIRDAALPSGGWAIYKGGPPDISASVLSYFALKLAGVSSEEPDMKRSMEVILNMGGMTKARTYTKYHLAMFGVYQWDHVPAVPPELIFLPSSFPMNLYEMAAWARTIFVPLSILYGLRPVVSTPPGFSLDELLPKPREKVDFSLLKPERLLCWDTFFLTVDVFLKAAERLPIGRLRKKAIERAAAWFIPRAVQPGGLGAILPAMANSVMALKCLGYPLEHPFVQGGLKEIERLEVHEPSNDSIRVQPCFSPVWDTAISLYAMAQGDVDEPDSMLRATRWLLGKQVNEMGDWQIKNRALPGGWFFEFDNPVYPDVDDSTMAIMALRRAWKPGDYKEVDDAIRRGLDWVMGMQNRDGGWGSFDRDNHKEILTHVPFADFNAMIDPSTADIAGRVLEMLGTVSPREFHLRHPAVRRAIEYIRHEQCQDGSWYGRWGCNYIYGTWQVLRGLRVVGEKMDQPYIRKAVRWIAKCQNRDGGWGELPDSYDDPQRKGKGPSTPSQTAWALMGLLAAGGHEPKAVRQAVDYLLERQLPDGTWKEDGWTGTGFPQVFYLKYGLYEHNWPFMALIQYQRTIRGLKF